MQPKHSTSFLKLTLVADAVASGATGLLLAAGAGFLSGLLALPEPLMRYAGLFLLPYAAIVWWVGSRAEISRANVRLIVAANFAWSAASMVLLASGAISPSLLGSLFVTGQAVVVAAFAILQVMGLSRVAEGQPA